MYLSNHCQLVWLVAEQKIIHRQGDGLCHDFIAIVIKNPMPTIPNPEIKVKSNMCHFQNKCFENKNLQRNYNIDFYHKITLIEKKRLPHPSFGHFDQSINFKTGLKISFVLASFLQASL